MQTKNPFNPTFGDVPNIFLDKQKQVDELIQTIQTSDFARSFFITGVRGSGKTSFLTKISEQLQDDPNCYLIDLINENGILTTLARKLYHQNGSKLSELFDSLNSISIGGVAIEREKEIPNIEIMLEELMQSVASKNKYVVITIDEVSNSKAIQSFAKEFNALKRKKYPIYVIMTGLPDLILDIQNDDKLTFLLRSEKIEMQPLSTISFLHIKMCLIITLKLQIKWQNGPAGIHMLFNSRDTFTLIIYKTNRHHQASRT